MSHPSVGVVIMAKQPVPGHVKTRLHSPSISPDDAAALYAAMLADRCAQVRSLDGAVPAIALIGPGDRDGHRAAVPDDFVRVPQPDTGGLGAGLEAAAAHFLDAGTPVVLVDSDTPTLPLAYLEDAISRLRGGHSDLVLGPAEDGGYYLIGLARPAPELFRDIPWSTDQVTRVTLERAARLGLDVHQLPAWWDVDTPADVDRLERSLFRAWWPHHTAAWLRERDRRNTARDGSAAREDLCDAEWHRLSSRAVYATPWLSVREDRVRMPDGVETTYSVIDTGECVGVLPFVDPDTVLLVRQYRYVAGRVTLEMPTGGVHPGEDPERAARRELAEEAKASAGRLEYLGSYHTSKSVMDETAHLYIARDLGPASASGDDTEFIGTEPVAFCRVLDMVLSGEITDSMTIIAVLRAARS